MRSLCRPPRIDWPPSASGRHAIANTERLAPGPAHFANLFHSPSRGAIPSRRPTSHTPGPFVSGAAPTPSRGSARASVIRLGELARSEPIASMNDRSDRRSLPSSFHRRGAVASMLGERSIPFGDEGLQPFERWMAGVNGERDRHGSFRSLRARRSTTVATSSQSSTSARSFVRQSHRSCRPSRIPRYEVIAKGGATAAPTASPTFSTTPSPRTLAATLEEFSQARAAATTFAHGLGSCRPGVTL